MTVVGGKITGLIRAKNLISQHRGEDVKFISSCSRTFEEGSGVGSQTSYKVDPVEEILMKCFNQPHPTQSVRLACVSFPTNVSLRCLREITKGAFHKTQESFQFPHLRCQQRGSAAVSVSNHGYGHTHRRKNTRTHASTYTHTCTHTQVGDRCSSGILHRASRCLEAECSALSQSPMKTAAEILKKDQAWEFPHLIKLSIFSKKKESQDSTLESVPISLKNMCRFGRKLQGSAAAQPERLFLRRQINPFITSADSKKRPINELVLDMFSLAKSTEILSQCVNTGNLDNLPQVVCESIT